MSVRTALLSVAGGALVGSLALDLLRGANPGFGLVQWAGVGFAGYVALLAMLPKKPRAGWMAAGMSFAGCVVLLEVGVRVVLGDSLAALYEFDPELLHRPRAGATRVFIRNEINGGHWIRTATNEQGFRGPKLRQPPGSPRVVIYGDSFIMAEYAEPQVTFAAQLERKLGPDAEVINAGVSAFGPDQSLRRMQKTLKDLAPDHVVFSVYVGNDFGDLIRNGMYRVDSGGELIERELKLDAVAAQSDDSGTRGLMLSILFRRLTSQGEFPEFPDPENVEAKQALVEDWLVRGKQAYARYNTRDPFAPRDLTGDHYDADVALEPSSPRAQDKVALLSAVLGEATRRTTELGVPITFLIIPSGIDVEPNNDAGAVDREAHPDYRPSNLTSLAERAAAGAPVVNLFEPFSRSSEPLYLRGGNDHWNARGQEIAASLVAAQLEGAHTREAKRCAFPQCRSGHFEIVFARPGDRRHDSTTHPRPTAWPALADTK